MSFDTSKKESQKDFDIYYTYTTNKIYKTENTIPTLGYLSVSYKCQKCDQDVIIINKNNKSDRKLYKTTNLYITKSQKLVKDISYDFDFIIKQQLINDETKILYTCFLLKSNISTETNNIDHLIDFILKNSKNEPSIDFTLIDLVSKNNDNYSIYYEIDSNTKVVILTTPINIRSVPDPSFSDLFLPLFNITPRSYDVIKQPINEDFHKIYDIRAGTKPVGKEGMTSTAYCQPIDMTDSKGETIKDDPQLNIPLIGRYSPNDATNNVIRTAINFMAFTIVLGFTYLLAPIIYNDFIIGLIEYTGQGKMDRLRSIDIYICFIFIMLTFGFITIGVQKNISNSTIIGFFIGLFFIISMTIIQSKKISGAWFNEVFDTDDANYENISFGEDFGKFFMENFSILISNYILVLFIVVISFLILFIFGFFNNGIFTDKNSFIFVSLIPLDIYIIILIATLKNKSE
jgi:hypothetical protein